MCLNSMLSISTFLFLGAVLHSVSGQTCDTAGCLNGDCILGTPPVCQCRSGFVKSADPNICLDINECAQTLNPCVSTSAYYHYGYYSPYGQNQCINTQGGYQCQCNPPSYPYGNPPRCYTSPYYQPQPQPSLYQTYLTYSLFGGDFGDFGDFGDLFDFKK